MTEQETTLMFILMVIGLVTITAAISEPVPPPKTSPYQHYVLPGGIPLTVYYNEEGQLLTCHGEEVDVLPDDLIPTNDRCW